MTYCADDYIFTEYKGDFNQDVKEGNGSMLFKNGNLYEGDWKNNMMNGKGKLTFNCKEYKHFEDPLKRYEEQNENLWDYYEGHFINNDMYGEGKVTFKNGDVYIGNMSNNMFNGYGQYKCSITLNKNSYSIPRMAKYQGQFKDGNMEGIGKLLSLIHI